MPWHRCLVFYYLCEMSFSNYDLVYSDQKLPVAQDSGCVYYRYLVSGRRETDVNLGQFLMAHWGFLQSRVTETSHKEIAFIFCISHEYFLKHLKSDGLGQQQRDESCMKFIYLMPWEGVSCYD